MALDSHQQEVLEQAASRRAQARDTATPQRRLRELAAEPHWPGVANALAANPSTPLDVLARLTQIAPRAFCRNPILPLILLEDPDFIEKMPEEGKARVLSSPRAPLWLIQSLAERTAQRDWRLAVAARFHIALAGETPETSWAEEIRIYWRAQMIEVRKLKAGQETWELADLGLIPAALAAFVFPEDPYSENDFDAVRLQAEREDQKAFEQGMSRPMDGKIKDGHHDFSVKGLMRFLGAAFSPRVSAPRLAELTQHQEPLVAAAVARHPLASSELLKTLIRHHNPAVRRAAARHPALPEAEALAYFNRRCKEALRNGYNYYHATPTLDAIARFSALRYAADKIRRPFWPVFTDSPDWQDRLAAAVAMTPHPDGLPLRPKHDNLLQRLTYDGNRLVRAAARARLRGEEFAF